MAGFMFHCLDVCDCISLCLLLVCQCLWTLPQY